MIEVIEAGVWKITKLSKSHFKRQKKMGKLICTSEYLRLIAPWGGRIIAEPILVRLMLDERNDK